MDRIGHLLSLMIRLLLRINIKSLSNTTYNRLQGRSISCFQQRSKDAIQMALRAFYFIITLTIALAFYFIKRSQRHLYFIKYHFQMHYDTKSANENEKIIMCVLLLAKSLFLHDFLSQEKQFTSKSSNQHLSPLKSKP